MSDAAMLEERWLPVVGWEGRYEVSEFGRVRRLGRFVVSTDGQQQNVFGHMLKTSVGSLGYRTVALPVAGAPAKRLYVHRMVLEAFLYLAPEGTEACHGDGDRLNNDIRNLRWDTSAENNLDIVRLNRHWQKKKADCPRGHPLIWPNLVTQRWKNLNRSCLACARAFAVISARRRQSGPLPDLKVLSDEKFVALMEKAGLPVPPISEAS